MPFMWKKLSTTVSYDWQNFALNLTFSLCLQSFESTKGREFRINGETAIKASLLVSKSNQVFKAIDVFVNIWTLEMRMNASQCFVLRGAVHMRDNAVVWSFKASWASLINSLVLCGTDNNLSGYGSYGGLNEQNSQKSNDVWATYACARAIAAN